MSDSSPNFALSIPNFGGLIADRNVAKISAANASDGYNFDITPSGSIKTSPQYSLVGTDGGAGSSPITSSTTFKTRYNDSIEIYHAGTSLYYWNTKTLDYEVLKTGLSDGAFFGFCTSSENTEFQDFEYMCNGIDNDMRWNGAHDKLQTALSGASTELEISSSIFTSTVLVEKTSTSSTSTTITLSSANWGTNSFANRYVEITTGANAGAVSKITSNTGTVLTLTTAISGLTGAVGFKIRTLRFSDTGSLLVDGNEIAYTGFVSSTKFIISGTYTISAGTAVTQTVTEYPNNPKGNMMLMKDGCRLVASTFNSTIYRSRVFNHKSFTMSSPRAAGEGDIIDVVEGTGNLTGLADWKGYFLALKTDLVKPYKYTEYNQVTSAVDSNDIVTSEPDDTRAAPLIGGSYPLGTFAVDNAVISCVTGRGFRILFSSSSMLSTSTDELSLDIADIANACDNSLAAGRQHLDTIYIATKTSASAAANNVVYSFNRKTLKWNLPKVNFAVSSFFEKDGSLYATSATRRAVYKLNESLDADLGDGEEYPTDCLYVSGAMRGTTVAGKRSSFGLHYIKGRMNLATTLTVTRKLELDGSYKEEPASFSYTSNPAIFQIGSSGGELGSEPLGSVPLAASGADESSDFTDMYPFSVYIEWKPQSVNEWQIAFSTSGHGQEVEILEQAFDIKEENTLNKQLIISP